MAGRKSVVPSLVREFLISNPEASKEEVVQRVMQVTGMTRKGVLLRLREMEKMNPTSGGTPVSEPHNKTSTKDGWTSVPEVEGDHDDGRSESVADLSRSFARTALRDRPEKELVEMVMGEGDLVFVSKSQNYGCLSVHVLSQSPWADNKNVGDIPVPNLFELRANLIRTLRAVENHMEDLDLLGRVTRREGQA